MNRIKYILSTLFILLYCGVAYSQSVQERAILMRGEVHKEKVFLRWAPTDARTWQLLNKYGVQLERLTIVRDGIVLAEPEKLIISDTLKPEESQFMSVDETDPYAAIIAQAVFGESFVVSGSGDMDISSIIALSDELQQRYVLSLYAADLSFDAALMAGWGWEDHVSENERYLYNVIPLVPEDELSITPGALFVDASRLDHFPKPLDFNGQFMDSGVLLSWNYRTQEALYNAYIPERSTDGVNFAPITDIPITRMDSGTNNRITYADSIGNGITYYYRLAGITPFGSMSTYSDTISGMGMPELRNPPFITKAIPNNEGGVDIEWAFEDEDEALIEDFTVERSDNDKVYADYVASIDRKQRSIALSDVPSANYFVVAANTVTGKRVRSFSAFVQPVDSLPPAVPVGLTAIADTTGTVKLSWQANKEEDILGYRIFRGQTSEEEMIPLNDIAVTDTMFVDSINLKLLNHKVYYAIAALDERYNQSDKSPVVEVIKPETIPPTPPFIREIKVENGKNVILWVSGQEENLAGYELLRKADGEDEFTMLTAIDEPGNCIYEDSDVENNKAYIYHIKSRSMGGLLSEPSPDYKVRAISKSDAKHSIIFTVTPQKESIVLNWEISIMEAANIQFFKKTGDGTFSLFREGVAVTDEIRDENVVSGTKYEYMLVVKTNGASPQVVTKSVTL